MPTPTYTIHATPKVLERVYYAIERCRARPELSAQAINREVETKFGTPLSTQIWTVLNAARRDDALSQVKTKAFDFAKHGRLARTGKRKDSPAKTATALKAERRQPSTRRSGDALQRVKLNTRKHPRYLVSVWREGRREHHTCRTRKQADRLVRRYLSQGLPLGDVAVYQAEALAIRLVSDAAR